MEYFFRFKRDFFLNNIGGMRILPISMRLKIYRLYGIPIGKNTTVLAKCYLGGHNIRLGNRCFINSGCHFDSKADIEIEDDVWCGMDVLFCTSTHQIGTQNQRAGSPIGKAIHVGRGSWIGARAVILPGVTIGEGCIIAAGSVVTKDVPSNEMWGGNPARFIKKLD